MEVKKHIPNIITLSNLLLGVLAIVYASSGELLWAAAFIFLATIPDFLDGMMARILKVTSDIGKDLDSLADMVSFGVAPAILIYNFELYYQPVIYDGLRWIPYLVLLVPLFSALRLAKFNNDDRQSDEFYGLPTPAVALTMASWPFMLEFDMYNLDAFLISKYTFIALPIVLSLLMVSDIRLFSLKFKNVSFNENIHRYFIIICALILGVFLQFGAVPIVILLYILISIYRNFAR